MENRNLSDREKNYARAKSITNYVFGALIIGAGVAFCWRPKSLEPIFKEYDSSSLTLLGVVCFIYGAFRIYRGYAQNYFN
jgi:hypothetical protein